MARQRITPPSDVAGAAAAAQAAAATYTDTVAAGKAQATVRTAVKTANYTAAAGQLVPVDTATPNANVTVTLPSGPAAGSRVAVKHIAVGTGKSVTVACAGSDVFNKAAGSTSVSLTLLNQAVTVQYDAGIWTVVSDDLPLSALSGAYVPGQGTPADNPARIIVGPTLPTLPTGTEYVWNQTDGAGTLVDIVSGVA